MSRLLRALLPAALLLLPFEGVAQDYDALNNGVVKIVSTSPEGKRRTGTGFIARLEGDVVYIVTAYHVVEGDKQPVTYFFARRNVPVAAEVIRGDPRLDAALLVVRGRNKLPQSARALPLEVDQSLKRGQEVATIGFPSGLGDWAVGKSTIAAQEGSDLTLSGAIAEGNSGSPVLHDGKVVAMVTAVQGIAGRAVPALILRYALQGWGVEAAGGGLGGGGGGTVEPFKDCAECPEMVKVPAGRFTMGSPETERGRLSHEGPAHEVKISKPFAAGKYEITRGQFARFMLATKRDMSPGCWVWDDKDGKARLDSGKSWRDPGFPQSDDHPVVCVSFVDAKAYAEWLAGQTGKPYRLLSEAEWEYAARAGSTTARFWGDGEDEACEHANVADQRANSRHPVWTWQTFACDDRQAETAPVGKYKANAFGLHDMLGNVWEWVEDCWNASYQGAPVDGSARLSGECDDRAIRGGSWSSFPDGVRSANRYGGTSSDRGSYVGFRVARPLP